MSCHVEDQLSAYMDDELNEEERQQVETHLESCDSCQVLLEELFTIQSSVIHTFSQLQAPADFEIRVQQAIADREETPVFGKGWLFVPLMAFIALGLLWIATGAVFVKLVHGFLKLMIAMVYTASHLISGVPVLSGITVVLSLIIISTSVYSLRRLLQTSTS